MDGGIEPVDVAPGPLATLMEGALAALEAHTDAWPFRRPVDASEAVRGGCALCARTSPRFSRMPAARSISKAPPFETQGPTGHPANPHTTPPPAPTQ